MEYNYPIRNDWTTEEIIEVIAFYDSVEKAYEIGIERTELIEKYRAFKKIVPTKSEEKTLFKEFEDASGYICFTIIKAATERTNEKKIFGKNKTNPY